MVTAANTHHERGIKVSLNIWVYLGIIGLGRSRRWKEPGALSNDVLVVGLLLLEAVLDTNLVLCHGLAGTGKAD